MSEANAKPRLWSDFDGTAVGLVKKTDPRNWSKYPLPGIPGFKSFLMGVESEGVEIAGVISRRPSIRRSVTARSVLKLGLADFFGKPGQLVLAGSEGAKGTFLAQESLKGPVGMVEDKPHKMAAILMSTLLELAEHSDDRSHSLVIGVVSHDRTHEYIDRFVTEADKSFGNDVRVVEPGEGSFTLQGPAFSVNLTPLEPYSARSGENFAQLLRHKQ